METKSGEFQWEEKPAPSDEEAVTESGPKLISLGLEKGCWCPPV